MDTVLTTEGRVAELRKRFKPFDIRHDPDKYRLDYPERLLRKASILIPLSFQNGEYWLTLTVRSKTLTHHAGSVAFPGGMTDETDHDQIHTALREAEEEIGLKHEDVEVIAVCAPGIVKPNSLVYPVIGLVPHEFVPITDHREVTMVFKLPLKRFLSKDRFWIEEIESPIKATGKYHVHHYEDEVNGTTVTTWGMTAGYCIMTALCVLDSNIEFCFYENFIMNKNTIFSIDATKRIVQHMVRYVSKM